MQWPDWPVPLKELINYPRQCRWPPYLHRGEPAEEHKPTNARVGIMALERQAEELAKVSPPDKAARLRQAADLLTEARACEL